MSSAAGKQRAVFSTGPGTERWAQLHVVPHVSVSEGGKLALGLMHFPTRLNKCRSMNYMKVSETLLHGAHLKLN